MHSRNCQLSFITAAVIFALKFTSQFFKIFIFTVIFAGTFKVRKAEVKIKCLFWSQIPFLSCKTTGDTLCRLHGYMWIIIVQHALSISFSVLVI